MTGEMAQWLRALTALPEVLSSIPSNHMVAHNHLQWALMPSSGVSGDIHNMKRDMKKNGMGTWWEEREEQWSNGAMGGE